MRIQCGSGSKALFLGTLSKNGSVYVWYLSCSVKLFFMWQTIYQVTIASFLASFYALSVSASLEYVEYAAMLLPLYNVFQDADTDNA
jgi:hypothetical protein